MASTTRRKKKKKVAVKKEKIIRAEAPVIKDVLDEADMVKIGHLSTQVTIAKMAMALEEQSAQNMLLELELYKVKIDKQRNLVRQKAEIYETAKIKLAEFRKQIDPKYGLKEGDALGYNPETGDIIR